MNGRIGLGIIGEKFNNSVAKSIFKVKEGYRVRHVDWDNYSYGHGLDLRVFKRNKQVMAIEVKNWRKMNRPYGTDIARTEIIDRFKNCAGGIKVLIISFLCLLTKQALTLLEKHNIHIIETRKLIGKNDFPKKGRNNKVFYSLKSKLSKLWCDLKQARTKVCGCVNSKQVRLDKIDINDNTTNTKPNKQHDSDCEKLASNYAMNLVRRAIKLEELKRKHPMYTRFPDSWLDK